MWVKMTAIIRSMAMTSAVRCSLPIRNLLHFRLKSPLLQSCRTPPPPRWHLTLLQCVGKPSPPGFCPRPRSNLMPPPPCSARPRWPLATPSAKRRQEEGLHTRTGAVEETTALLGSLSGSLESSCWKLNCVSIFRIATTIMMMKRTGRMLIMIR